MIAHIDAAFLLLMKILALSNICSDIDVNNTFKTRENVKLVMYGGCVINL